jgi:hypothetical protein
MKKFNDFIVECGCGNVPVVSLSKTMVNLTTPDTRNEINRNISAELSSEFMSPAGAWMKIGKVLSMYNIFLPKIDFFKEREGEKIIAIQQFGDRWGAQLDGTITSPGSPDIPEYYLYFVYGISYTGFCQAYASVVNEEELNDLIDDIDSIIPPEGNLDSRQKNQ